VASASTGQGGGGGSPGAPSVISRIIARGHSAGSKGAESFTDIFKFLRQNDFMIVEGVDSDEVSDFVKLIEWSEALIE
jgi:hypothetical protein